MVYCRATNSLSIGRTCPYDDTPFWSSVVFNEGNLPMKATLASCLSYLIVVFISMASAVSVLAQEISASGIDQLKAQMNSQQKLIEKQQARIDALESALAEQHRILVNVIQAKAQGAMLV